MSSLQGDTSDIAQLIDKIYMEENKIALSVANDKAIISVAAAADTNDQKAIPKATALAQEKLALFAANTKLGSSYEGVAIVGRNGHVIAESGTEGYRAGPIGQRLLEKGLGGRGKCRCGGDQ